MQYLDMCQSKIFVCKNTYFWHKSFWNLLILLYIHSLWPIFYFGHILCVSSYVEVVTWTSIDGVRRAFPVSAARTTRRREGESTWRSEERRRTSLSQVDDLQDYKEILKQKQLDYTYNEGLSLSILPITLLSLQCGRLVTWCPWILMVCQTHMSNLNWFQTQRATANRRPRPSAPHSILSGMRVSLCESLWTLIQGEMLIRVWKKIGTKSKLKCPRNWDHLVQDDLQRWSTEDGI